MLLNVFVSPARLCFVLRILTSYALTVVFLHTCHQKKSMYLSPHWSGLETLKSTHPKTGLPCPPRQSGSGSRLRKGTNPNWQAAGPPFSFHELLSEFVFSARERRWCEHILHFYSGLVAPVHLHLAVPSCRCTWDSLRFFLFLDDFLFAVGGSTRPPWWKKLSKSFSPWFSDDVTFYFVLARVPKSTRIDVFISPQHHHFAIYRDAIKVSDFRFQ